MGAVAGRGTDGLFDRSSAPKRIPHKTLPELVEEIVRLRRLWMTASDIATVLRDGALNGLCWG